MSHIIVRKRGALHSYFYEVKTLEEMKYLYGALSLVEGVETVSASSVEAYGE